MSSTRYRPQKTIFHFVLTPDDDDEIAHRLDIVISHTW